DSVVVEDDPGLLITATVVQPGFEVARLLGKQIRIRESWEVKVIERRRLECRTRAYRKSPRGAENIPIGQRTCRAPAELRAVIVANNGFRGLGAGSELIKRTDR